MTTKKALLAFTARAAAASCALVFAWPEPSVAFALGRLMPGMETATLAVLGLGLTVLGVAIGRRNRD